MSTTVNSDLLSGITCIAMNPCDVAGRGARRTAGEDTSDSEEKYDPAVVCFTNSSLTLLLFQAAGLSSSGDTENLASTTGL